MATAMVTTIVLSGCSSVDLNLDSDNSTTTEESIEVNSDDKQNAPSDKSIEETSQDQNDDTDKDITEEEDSTEDDSVEDDSKKTSDDLTGYDSEDMMDGEDLSEAELEKIQEYLNQTDNYGFTLESFRDSEDIDWGNVFAYGAGIENCDYSEEAVDAYLEASEYYDTVEYDLIALSGDDVRSFVERKTGLADFDVSSVSGFIYVEEYDILFSQVSDFYDKDVFCKEGVRSGNLIQVVFQVGMQDNMRRITLEETSDTDHPYLYLSNRELWEENAVEIIEASIYEDSEKVTCAVIKTEKGPDIEVINNNAVACVAHPRFREVDKVNIEQYSDIVEIEFCDVNSDGIGDMVVILSDGENTIAVLCEGFIDEEEDKEGYAIGAAAVSDWISENVSDVTADNVISYILDHQDELEEL